MWRAAGQPGHAGGGAGDELAAADGGVHNDDVLGVDQPGGAGRGDDLAGQVVQPAGRRWGWRSGRRARRRVPAPAGRRHTAPAGSVPQQPGAGAAAAGDRERGLPSGRLPGRQQPSRGPVQHPPPGGCGGSDHRGLAVGDGDQIPGPGERRDDLGGRRWAGVPGAALRSAAVHGGQAHPDADGHPNPGAVCAAAGGLGGMAGPDRPEAGRRVIHRRLVPRAAAFPLTLKKSGFRGLFSRRPPEKFRGKESSRRCRVPVKMSSGSPSCHLVCHLCRYLSSSAWRCRV